MVVKKYLDSMLDQSGFGDANEMGELKLEKVPEVSLAPEPFWAPIFASSEYIGGAAKKSVSTTSPPYVSLYKKPPTILLLQLQYIQIHFLPL